MLGLCQTPTDSVPCTQVLSSSSAHLYSNHLLLCLTENCPDYSSKAQQEKVQQTFGQLWALGAALGPLPSAPTVKHSGSRAMVHTAPGCSATVSAISHRVTLSREVARTGGGYGRTCAAEKRQMEGTKHRTERMTPGSWEMLRARFCWSLKEFFHYYSFEHKADNSQPLGKGTI